MKYIYKLIFLLLTTLMLTSCGSSTNSFTWFVDAIPTNLDPQIAMTSEDVIACTNLYGTLLRKDEDGTLQLDLAESYTISADEKTYTFTLKDDLLYYSRSNPNEDYPLTAADFVFAFTRIFSAETASPYTALYSNIKNSIAFLEGSASAQGFGVTALDEKTVQFTLETADSAFLETLALPAAAPCNQDFFENTKGTYGLTSSTTLGSGPFHLYNWTATGLFLRRSGDASLVNNLRLVENSNSTDMSAQDLILEEKCTAVTDITASETTLRTLPYSDTTWCLLYNQNTVLANQDLRAALAAVATGLDLTAAGTLDPSVQGIIPEGIDVEGLDYRQEHGSALPTLSPASDALAEALATLSMSDLQKITLLIPEGNGLEPYLDSINQAWQVELSLYCSVEIVDQATFDRRLAQGDYTLAIAPIVIRQNDLGLFLDELAQTCALGEQESEFLTLLQRANETNGTQKCRLLYEAECLFLEHITVTPLFAQQKRLLVDTSIAHLIFDPFGPVLDLTYATKS